MSINFENYILPLFYSAQHSTERNSTLFDAIIFKVFPREFDCRELSDKETIRRKTRLATRNFLFTQIGIELFLDNRNT